MSKEWPTKEESERMKSIGQNGNTGEHYNIVKSDMIISVDFEAGVTIRDAVTDAKRKAKMWNASIEFEFNGEKFRVNADTDIDDMVSSWRGW